LTSNKASGFFKKSSDMMFSLCRSVILRRERSEPRRMTA
jgi:hypothetical protein